MERSGTLIRNISKAKDQLSARLEKVLAGGEIIIRKTGKPVAKIVRYEQRREQLTLGALRDRIKIYEHFSIIKA